jgi:hypothetical protein
MKAFSRFASAVTMLMAICVPVSAGNCPTVAYDPTTGIALRSTTDPTTFTLANPVKANLTTVTPAKAAVDTATLCWQTEGEATNGKACKDSSGTSAAPLPLTLGFCTNSADTTLPNGSTTFPLASTAAILESSDAIVVRFAPTAPVQSRQFLRVEWQLKAKAGQTLTAAELAEHHETYAVSTVAGVARFDEDSRYKLWLYSGYTFLNTQNDFSDSFAELRLRLESRFVDERIAMRQRHPEQYRSIVASGERCTRGTGCSWWASQPWFTILRLYGETGLTGVTAIDPSNAANTKVKQTFDGTFGIGYGKTLLVSVDSAGDTDAFSVLLLARLGSITIPSIAAGTDANGKPTAAVESRVAFKDFFGVHVENETGHFAGAYFELGSGEGEVYSKKKLPRMLADGFLPLNDPGGLFRLATRVQIDRPAPWGKLRLQDGPDTGSAEQERRGEVRISLLFNIDIKQLTHRLRVPQPNAE